LPLLPASRATGLQGPLRLVALATMVLMPVVALLACHGRGEQS